MTSKSDYNFELYVNSNVHLQKIEIGQAISLIQLDFKSMGGGGHHAPPPLSLSLSLSPRQPGYEWSHFDHGNLLIKNHYAI